METTAQPPLDFWQQRRNLNVRVALPYQWETYERVGTTDNFRIAAGLLAASRKGFFYTDSDLHKWADAVCRCIGEGGAPELEPLLDLYIDLVAAAQQEDGYLYTYNQVNFPDRRWENLFVEHELYCHGHFIEAGVEHALAFGSAGNDRLLSLAVRSADLICRDFASPTARRTPGHPEIEIALLRLHRLTGVRRYFDTAAGFLNARGRLLFPGIALARDDAGRRNKAEAIVRRASQEGRPPAGGAGGYDFTETSRETEAPFIRLRQLVSFLTGRYMQHNRPLRRQCEPVGHAVRWAYLMTAAAMTGTEADRHPELSDYSWMRDAARDAQLRALNGKTYVSGGTGSLPLIEGFGRKWELDDEHAYCETCAAIGSVFLSHELSRAATDPFHAELIEWRLYNAASVGIGMDGTSYFYRNPLASRGGIRRQPWFDTACCPSNISRLWGGVQRYVCSWKESCVFVDQYIAGFYEVAEGDFALELRTTLPWDGVVAMKITNRGERNGDLAFRIPSWAGATTVEIGGVSHRVDGAKAARVGIPDFAAARYHRLSVPARSTLEVKLAFRMDVYTIAPWPRVANQGGRRAVCRGPLLYCLETTGDAEDDPVLRQDSFVAAPGSAHLQGTVGIDVRSESGNAHSLVPYYAWGNGGPTQMRVWLRARRE